MAVALSYILTAVSGYALYKLSDSRSEAQMSLMVRFIFNPAIALIIGFLVGLFSKDYPAPTAIVGLVPWALTLCLPVVKGALKGNPFTWIASILVHVTLGVAAALFASRWRQKRVSSPIT
jgi:hypothetical protein